MGDEWEKQMAEVSEAEEMEKLSSNIPSDIRDELKLLFRKVTIKTRMMCYKLLYTLHFENVICHSFYFVVNSIDVSEIDNLLTILSRYPSNTAIRLIDILYRLTKDSLTEFCNMSFEDVDEFLEVTRFITNHEVDLMTESIKIMSIREFMRMIKLTDEPYAKQCRLCRQKRIHDMEFKLQNKQLDHLKLPTVGVMPLHETVQEVWVSADYSGYMFDRTSGSIYWRNNLVDIVRICLNCLNEISRAVAEDCRFTEYYHVEAKLRKKLLHDMRDIEQARGKMFGLIAIERAHRRAREIAQTILSMYKKGVIRENEQKEQEKRDLERNNFLEAQRKAKDDLNQRIFSLDDKWRRQDYLSSLKELGRTDNIVNIALHPGFTEDNPVPKTREHPLSWRLSAFDNTSDSTVTGQLQLIQNNFLKKSSVQAELLVVASKGNSKVLNCALKKKKTKPLPITAEACGEEFGISHYATEVHLPELQKWKDEAIQGYNQYEERVRERIEAKRAAEVMEYNRLMNYIHDRTKELNVQAFDKQQRKEGADDDRIRDRIAGRNERMRERILGYEANERAMMALEETQMRTYLHFKAECDAINTELRNMHNEYLMQTKIDKFWGVDSAVILGKVEEVQRYRALDDLIEKKRICMVQMKLIKPYWWESESGSIKDIFSGDPIR